MELMYTSTRNANEKVTASQAAMKISGNIVIMMDR